MGDPLYAVFASKLLARENCVKTGNLEWHDKHKCDAEFLVQQYMPSGSGFDNGTRLDFDHSTKDKLVFYTAFHHMNEGGYYDGWTHHVVTITPSLAFGFNLKVGGKNRNEIKTYIADEFDYCLRKEIPSAEQHAKGECNKSLDL